ncbi:MAG: helix-turn-helix domain-containing protein [Rickettsiales bacterium]|nr:helix-turn-helix domain-containing protein [Rickettsiales bacterium]
MKNTSELPIPIIKALRKMGQDISEARRRRRITMELMAQRAGFSRGTLAKIEKGDPSTSMGNYASVLFVLGMIGRIGDLVDANHDLVGRQIDEENLPKKIRPRKIKMKNE